ncbi:hypothetical protein Aple_026320 [Acrocarpospora pleiomorpha]|uniref:Uncharacterized protein n=1 Tax=Acrocarpospora pleiomorpha TaxID=90975 RepID=A0A5M3XGF0_9ACTN|nr:hypothetical protein [Acrocarpospora pleiomorpha]GES19736.1 hypothetical protein Aple_026320 [Acrocarpospora pleiomorpha]
MWHLRVQRQLRSPYGWYDTHTYYAIQSISCNGGVGYTYMVPNSGGEDDRFRACVSVLPTTSPATIPESGWTCHSWHVF